MKKHRMFYGILFTGLGLILLTETWNIPVTEWWFDWPTIFILIGAAFIAESVRGHIPQSFLPGMLFVIFGIHFHLANIVPGWPNHLGMYIALLGAAMFIDYMRTKNSGLFESLLLAAVSLFYFFESEIYQMTAATLVSQLLRFVPLLFAAIGIYYLFVKKR